MNTIDRIKKLRSHYELYPIVYLLGVNVHEIIDELDKAADISTKWQDRHVCQKSKDKWTCAGDHRNHNYVGERLSLHESHIFVSSGAMYHWLGAEAEKLAA